MNINFVLGVRYPTEKAYGVTIGRTSQAIKELHNGSKLFVPSPATEDQFGNSLIDITYKLGFSHPPKRRSKIMIFVFALLDGVRIGNFLKIGGKLEREKFIFRDLALSIGSMIILPKGRVLLEIHHHTSKLKKMIIICLVKTRKARLITITQNSLPYKLGSAINVCYVGNATSSGHDNGLMKMINCIREASQTRIKVNLTIVGVPKRHFTSEAVSATSNFKVHFIDYVKHSEIPHILANQSVGVIPYPESRYHDYRFPIKAVEYAASSLSIIASDTPSHRSILSEDFAHFVDFDNSANLREKLLELQSNIEREQERRIQARKWSEKYSYLERAKLIILFARSN
jgi:glycosyltransferase involved in cell wall biosynthesis